MREELVRLLVPSGMPMVCIFALAACLAAAGDSSHAQTRAERVRSGPCQRLPAAALADLVARKLALKQEIARAETAAAGAQPDGKAKNAARKKLEAGLRKKQEALLQVIFQIDCQNTEPARDETRAAGVGTEVEQDQDR